MQFTYLFTFLFSSDTVVQGHRGNILEGLGCRPSIYNVTLAYPLLFVWSPFLCFVAAVYACLSFIAFVRLRRSRRKNIDEFFSSGYSITKDHYLRLMGFSLIPPFIMVPLLFFNLVVNIKSGVRPWISWEDTHSNFNRFDRYPASAIEANLSNYACALIEFWAFFFFFFVIQILRAKMYYVTRYIGCIVTTWPQPLVTAP